MFKILSLDGGGTRGILGAAFLSKLQKNLDAPIWQYFDLIAGTSVGGLIAVSLAMEVPIGKILDLLSTKSSEIFERPAPTKRGPLWWIANMVLRRASPEMDIEWAFGPKYLASNYMDVLSDHLGDRRLEEAKCRLTVPAVDLIGSKIIVFKTPHRPNFIRDREYLAKDVIFATSAAPTYFPSARISGDGAYVDGGLWANNPSMVAYVEAARIARDCDRPDLDPKFSTEDIFLLSIGTGESSYYMSQEAALHSGVTGWAPKIIGAMGAAQSEAVHWQIDYLLHDRYFRINFQLPEGQWQLDSVEKLDELENIGRQRAVEAYPILKEIFFSETAKQYTPFQTEEH